MAVMLTGRTGFVGCHLANFLRLKQVEVVTPVRNNCELNKLSQDLPVRSLFDLTEVMMQEREVKEFIHCAGIAHNTSIEPNVFKRVNTELTKALAAKAAKAGVKRFIFFSSIGVNGRETDSPFRADDKAYPYDSYTESKYDAEKGLKVISQETGMEVVIIRPPLIYGANAPGNFEKLVKLASLPIPKPLGSINNKRSFVSVDNLSDFIYLCLTHPAAANETFLVSDGEDLSTSQFLRKISKAMGKPAMLIPFPVNTMRRLASFFGKQELIDKLAVDLQVNIERNKTLLGWQPKVSVDEALRNALSQERA